VFDGHNGVHAAEFASQRILHGVTKSKHFPTDISTSLVRLLFTFGWRCSGLSAMQ
jgi:serine/threonine protein phosphatase PrpC